MLFVLTFIYAFCIGACSSAVAICMASDWVRLRRKRRLEQCTKLGRLALLAESNAIVWRSGR